MADSEFNDIISCLELLSSTVSQFLSELLNGNINGAKVTRVRIGRELGNLTALNNQNREILNKNNLSLIPLIQSIHSSLALIDASLNSLGIDNAEFSRDPATYTVLISSEFSHSINDILEKCEGQKKKFSTFLVEKSGVPRETFIKITPELIEYDQAYKDFKAAHTTSIHLIERVENKILNYPSFNIDLFEPLIRSGKGFYRAVLPHPLDDYRIVFEYIPNKILRFITIAKHLELSKLKLVLSIQ